MLRTPATLTAAALAVITPDGPASAPEGPPPNESASGGRDWFDYEQPPSLLAEQPQEAAPTPSACECSESGNRLTASGILM